MKKLHNIRNVVCIGHIAELEIFFIFSSRFSSAVSTFFRFLLLSIPLQDKAQVNYLLK